MKSLKLLSLFIFILKSIKIASYEVSCDYMGDCVFVIDNKTVDISQGNISLYKQISNEKISYKLNNTFYPLKLEKQIDGVSNYGLLKGTKNGYECSGGLWECKDSCCLDGFCVEILFFCDQENEYITFISLLIIIFFVTLVVLYWTTYCFLGFKFKDDLTKTMKEEKELYYFVGGGRKNISEYKERTNSIVNDTDNCVSQVPMMNNAIKNENINWKN